MSYNARVLISSPQEKATVNLRTSIASKLSIELAFMYQVRMIKHRLLSLMPSNRGVVPEMLASVLRFLMTCRRINGHSRACREVRLV
jgi:hypothetical protein